MTSTFIGNIEAKLDEKGRMFIPAVYRKILASEESQRIVMRRDTENECLVIYPERVWNQRVEQLSAELDEWNPDDQMLLMQFVADAEFVEPDSQGRILLQKRNLQQIGATGELLIVGMMNRFAIWDKQTFLSKRIDQREFAKTLRERMGKKHS
ncbi:MAG: division/cell wall cluster transcriptional repressor MraZ [Paludibacteraceae bacterium]|nr:division/cell wall cluster transcriptional repressor MraZ [Paludibacteraceae bacterium]